MILTGRGCAGNLPRMASLLEPHQGAIVLLAAGASSRMRGRDKLMEDIDGTPLLQAMIERALDTGLQVFVTLPHPDHPRAGLIGRATPVWVPDATEGMAASLRRSIAQMPETVQAAMILPSDMPDIEASDLSLIFNSLDSESMIVRGSNFQGKPGHPVLFPRVYFAELQDVQGDEGGRSVLKAHADNVQLIPLAGNKAHTDLNTPEAWAAWRHDRRTD